jgi:hypothetical protein
MKSMLRILSVGLGGALCVGALNANANLEVGASVHINATADFETPLAARGTWLMVGSYGRCWRPAVGRDWRPYCDGQWVWTDCGWYWASDEPWAWACYHYGTWTYDPDSGWVWVPGINWAPAWVTWREGGGYIGWAPCAPPGGMIDPSFFAFVDVAHFHDHIRPSALTLNNAAVASHTEPLHDPIRESRNIDGTRQYVMVNPGPDVDSIRKVTGQNVGAVPVQQAVLQTPLPSGVQRSSPNASPEGRPGSTLTSPNATMPANPSGPRTSPQVYRPIVPPENPAVPVNPASPPRYQPVMPPENPAVPVNPVSPPVRQSLIPRENPVAPVSPLAPRVTTPAPAINPVNPPVSTPVAPSTTVPINPAGPVVRTPNPAPRSPIQRVTPPVGQQTAPQPRQVAPPTTPPQQ